MKKQGTGGGDTTPLILNGGKFFFVCCRCLYQMQSANIRTVQVY